MNKKKKKTTTKNTQIKRNNKSRDLKSLDLYEKIAVWVVIAFGILTIMLRALNNHVVGYDHYIGIPIEWARSLFDN